MAGGCRLVKQAWHPFEEVRSILCYRLEPAEGAALFPVSVSGLSYFFLLHKIDIPGDDCPVASPAADHCYSPAWPMTAELLTSVTSVQSPDNLGQISPLPSSITTISSQPLPFPSLALPSLRPSSWYPGLLCFSSHCSAFRLSPCYIIVSFSPKVKMYFLNANESIWS